MHNMPHTEETKLKISMALRGVPCPHNRRATIDVDGETLYRCGRCGEFKPYSDFYKNKRGVLGITYSCKKCHNATSIATRDKERARDANREYARRARLKNPERFREVWRGRPHRRGKKESARVALNIAVRDGKIIKPDTCSECGCFGRITAHHNNYDLPLSVEWLCYECHGKRHRKEQLVYGLEVLEVKNG
jgi:hypothetical protein